MVEIREKIYREYECPNCHQKGCFQHCNHCGKDIKWLNNLGDPFYETNSSGRRVRYAYESNDSVHRCMRRGTKDRDFYNKKIPDEYILDDHRKIYRLGTSAEFKCTFCNRKGDLPVMMTHHTNDKQFDCTDKLMAKFFKEQPKTYINLKDHRLSEYSL